MKPYRVRFAPSPTGYLHVGGARTALYNFLLAKHYGGKFLLRIEDTDLERSTEESMRMVIQDLEWLGINWDEGPNPRGGADIGPHSPYRQSQRGDLYKKYADQLLDGGHAYYDFRTDAELEANRQEAIASGRGHHLERPERIVPLAEARERLVAGEKAAVRFMIKEKRDYVLNDLIRGEVRFPSDMVSDFVVLRSNGMPVYNFCCVIDDAEMQISHVFRAEEHLSNTVRQMMLYEALGFALPQFGHLSILLDAETRQKMSKRKGATSCHEFKEEGYLPEALCNFISLLGWSAGGDHEIFTREEQIKMFTENRFVASPAVFEETKLNWMNAHYLRALPNAELWRRLQPFFAKAGLELPQDPAWQDRALEANKTYMTKLSDAVALFAPLSDSAFAVKPEAQEVLAWPETAKVWQAWRTEVVAFAGDYMTEAEFNAAQERVKAASGAKGKTLFQPIRVAIIGQPHGTELKTLVPLLKKSSLIARVDKCLQG